MLGSRWKEISGSFPNRACNTIKNQFFSLVRKGLRKACRYCGVSLQASSVNQLRPKVLADFLSSSEQRSAPLDDSGLCLLSLCEVLRRFIFTKIPIPLQQNQLRRQIRLSLEYSLARLQTLKFGQQQRLSRSKREQKNPQAFRNPATPCVGIGVFVPSVGRRL